MHEWRQRASWLATDHKLGWSHSRPHSVQRREGCRSRRRRRGAGVVKGAALAVWNRAGAHKKEAAPQSMDSDGCQYAEAVGTCLDNIDSGSGGPPSRCRQGTGPALGSGRPRLSAGCRRIARARRRVTRPVTVSRTSLCRHSSESAHRALPGVTGKSWKRRRRRKSQRAASFLENQPKRRGATSRVKFRLEQACVHFLPPRSQQKPAAAKGQGKSSGSSSGTRGKRRSPSPKHRTDDEPHADSVSRGGRYGRGGQGRGGRGVAEDEVARAVLQLVRLSKRHS